ncbi:MAG: hypothetical protein H0W61_04815 [Bacteroidetes bacterium]|nr:hypothetical protein [Bacteroidota bacterium]
MDFIGSTYRLNDGGVGVKYHGKFLIEGKIKMYSLLNKYFSFKFSDIFEPIIGKYYFLLIPLEIKERKLGKAAAHFIKAVRLKPTGVFTDFTLITSTRSIFKKLYLTLFNPKSLSTK